MLDEKQAYQYQNYIPRPETARLKPVPGIAYVAAHNPDRNRREATPEAMAEAFMHGVTNLQDKPDFEDLFLSRLREEPLDSEEAAA